MFLVDLEIGAFMVTGVDWELVWDDEFEGDSIHLAGSEGVCFEYIVEWCYVHAKECLSEFIV
jgi:hypothetical protein